MATTVLAIVTFAITAFGNVPLNNALEVAGSSVITAARTALETPWTRLNDLHTLTSLLILVAAVGVLIALI